MEELVPIGPKKAPIEGVRGRWSVENRGMGGEGCPRRSRGGDRGARVSQGVSDKERKGAKIFVSEAELPTKSYISSAGNMLLFFLQFSSTSTVQTILCPNTAEVYTKCWR